MELSSLAIQETIWGVLYRIDNANEVSAEEEWKNQ